MGPLVPDIIGNELNLITALFIGLLFGLILEQAGFSTSKKLVGLFYGYDFTVLRVFFTAGIVAMLGVIAFDHYGLLDMSLIYINPTFLWSAIVGGLIMGLGFVVGGFCPGTSICAAAIGKIDAMLFILGSALGVLIFMEGYPLFEGIYKSSFLGSLRIFDSLGISQAAFALLLTATAVLAFWLAGKIEQRVNGQPEQPFSFRPHHGGLTIAGLILIVSISFLPQRKEAVLNHPVETNAIEEAGIKIMSSDELAFLLIDKDPKLKIFDFRSADEYSQFRLPGSYSYTVDNLFGKDGGKVLAYHHQINLIVAEDEASERKIGLAATRLGFKNIVLLKGGLAEFKTTIIGFDRAKALAGGETTDTIRFRTKASSVLPVLIEQSKNSAPVKNKTKRVLGGC